jgi:HK97 family phage prohead protease
MTDQSKPRHRSTNIEIVEYRSAPAQLEVRAGKGKDEIEIQGYPVVFDSPGTVEDRIGAFTEIVKRGSTKGCESNRIGLYLNHNSQGLALASTVNGSVTWSEDSKGVLMQARMNGNRQDVNDVACAISDGLASQMSFGFRQGTTGKDVWSSPNGVQDSLRTITKFGQLSDFSILTVEPAYAETSVSMREMRFANWAESEIRAGRVISKSNMVRLDAIASHLTSAHAHTIDLLNQGGTYQDGTTSGGTGGGPPNGGGPAIGAADGSGSRSSGDDPELRKFIKRALRDAKVQRAVKVSSDNKVDRARLLRIMKESQ